MLASEYLQYIAHVKGTVQRKRCFPIVCGDLNFHLEDQNNSSSASFQNLIEATGYIRHNSQPTHTAKGTLDVAITKNPLVDERKSARIENLMVFKETGTTSDHYLITFTVPCKSLIFKPEWKLITLRNYKSINIENLKSDLANFSLNDINKLGNLKLDNAVTMYNNELQRIVEMHAPLVTHYVKTNVHPWWNKQCQEVRTACRKAERLYKKSRTKKVRLLYKKKCYEASIIIYNIRETYFRQKLASAQGDSKTTYIINYLLGRSNYKIFPTGDNEKIANDFAQFFQSKIEKIHFELLKTNQPLNSIPKHPNLVSDITKLTSFETISVLQLKQVIMSMTTKSCALDSIPTWLLKQVIGVVIPIIHYIVNKSLQSGRMPNLLKTAIVSPPLKETIGLQQTLQLSTYIKLVFFVKSHWALCIFANTWSPHRSQLIVTLSVWIPSLPHLWNCHHKNLQWPNHKLWLQIASWLDHITWYDSYIWHSAA